MTALYWIKVLPYLKAREMKRPDRIFVWVAPLLLASKRAVGWLLGDASLEPMLRDSQLCKPYWGRLFTGLSSLICKMRTFPSRPQKLLWGPNELTYLKAPRMVRGIEKGAVSLSYLSVHVLSMSHLHALFSKIKVNVQGIGSVFLFISLRLEPKCSE